MEYTEVNCTGLHTMNRILLHLLVGTLAVGAVGSSLKAAPDQPNMRAALELLQQAKKADQPLPLLNSARHRLKIAAKNKGGNRLEAIEYVNEAITCAKTGDLKKMEQKVNAAIANIHSGMGKGR